jgi:5-methylcytosine-specific restriction endonuclease McrA
MSKKQEFKRLSSLARKLVYLSGEKFQLGIGVYAQAITLAMKVIGVENYSGHPRNFIKQNLLELEAHVKKNALEISRYKNNRNLVSKVVSKPSSSPKSLRVSGINVKSTEFLSTYEWRKLRMMALKKYGARCQCCGATPPNAVMNVDHIKPRKLFPSLALDINNLQILCHECNHGKGNWDRTDWR